MITPLRIWLFLIIGLTLLISTAFSQKLANGGLVITGNVEKIGVGYGNKCIPSVLVYLQFRNDGVTPLILLRPRFPIAKKVAFISTQIGDSIESTTDGDVFERSTLGRSNVFSVYDSVDDFLTSIDKPKPPEYSSIIINPGFSYEFRDELLIRNGFDFEYKPNVPCNETQIPVPKYRSFKVEYHLTAKKNDHSGELLERLQKRWKPFGHFLLDSDGGITYRSNEILLSDGR